MRFHATPVTGIVNEQKPQSFYTDVVSSLVEGVGKRFFSVVFYVKQVFFEADVKGVPSFANVEFGAFGAMNNIDNVVCLSVELFGDVHLGSLDVDGGTDEGAHFAFPLLHRVVPGVVVAGCHS